MNLNKVIAERFADALTAIGVDPEPYLGLVRPSQDPKFGDFQANFAMPLGKRLGKAPRDVAADIIAHFTYDDLLETPEIAGPGFINLRVKTSILAELAQAEAVDERLGVEKVAKPRKIVLDYSAPNVAKPLHVGHIRSTMIGNALSRILRFLGHNVISDNHLGDWGTQFGMIFYGYRNFLDRQAYETSPIDELARLYRLTRQLVDYFAAKKSLGELSEQIEVARNALDVQKKVCADAKAAGAAKDVLKKANKELDRLIKALESATKKYDEACSSNWLRDATISVRPSFRRRQNCITAILKTAHYGVKLFLSAKKKSIRFTLDSTLSSTLRSERVSITTV